MSTFVAALAALTLAQSPLAAPLALAQAPAAAPLTLGEALQRAAQANTDLRAAQAKLAQAKAGIWKGWSYHLPQVTAGATWTHNRDEAIIQFGGVDIVLQKQDQLAGQVEVKQALFAPQAWFGIQAAYKGADVAAKSAEGARREVLFGVAQAYYGVTSLKKLVKVSEELQGIAARQERDAKVRLDAGTIAKVGHLRAQIDLSRADQDLVRARNAYQSSMIALATLLDRDTDFEVVEPPEPALPTDTSVLAEEALKARPDLQAARLNEDLAVTLRRVSAARYLPSLGAFYRWQIANVSGFTGKSDSWAAGLGLSWSLFDGGLREGELREGSAKIAEAEATRRGLENRVTAEVRQALLDLDSARANAVKAREQARLAQENQRLVDVSFRAGAATAVEQADATAALRNAAIAATSDELLVNLSAVRLLKVAGVFEPVPRR